MGREKELRGRDIPPKEGLLFPPSRTISFRVSSLLSCFPLTDKKRRGREASTDVNYWVRLSGSPTEPVAMATHSGSGPLWEGRGCKESRGNSGETA